MGGGGKECVLRGGCVRRASKKKGLCRRCSLRVRSPHQPQQQAHMTHKAADGAQLLVLFLLVLVEEVNDVLQVLVASLAAHKGQGLIVRRDLGLGHLQHALLLGHDEHARADLLADVRLLLLCHALHASSHAARVALLVRLVNGLRVQRPLLVPLKLVQLKLLH